MSRIIYCEFLKKTSEGQDFKTYPGKLGEEIYKKISKIAWEKWLSEQTIIINEKKLNMLNKKDRQQLENCMKKFLFRK